MGQIIDIINGHVNEALGSNEDIKEERMAICRECPLYKETPMGPVCNSKLYINEKDKETVSDRPKIGYKRGCGCRLNSKCRLPHARCIILKW